ncbi:MAG: EAL domain-containing protein, partial [Armatimonadota bacterium]|nr:EAL domain-containing protein [Armatimonadota bacterium]
MSDGHLSILLVEDNEKNYIQIRDLLSQSKKRFDLEWVTTYEVALDAMACDHHDVYLLSHPFQDWDVLDLLRASENPGHKPVILLTGPENDEDTELDGEASQLGVVDYLAKERVNRSLLLRAIRYAVEWHRAQQSLRVSEERYELAARGANDGLWDWNLLTDEITFSPRWKAMLGYAEDEIGNHPDEWLGRVHPEDIGLLGAEIDLYIESKAPRFEREYRLLHKDGHYRWMVSRGITVQDSTGRVVRLAGSQTDISERKVAEEELMHSAFYDSLTSLPNRALFMDRLERAVSYRKRHSDFSFALLFLDLDRFKVVNDSLGHHCGDQLLIEVARRIESALRSTDTVARLGGDEFTILIEDIKEATDAARVAERIQKKLAAPFRLNGQKVFISGSIGITLSASAYERAEDILRDADTAMYCAKAQRGAGHKLFDAHMHVQAVRRLQLETDLRRAVEQQEFRLQYQPLVALETGRVTGFEALVRWQHPERGLLLPEEFIGLAEETGLIIPIDHGVLRTACQEMRLWRNSCGDTPLKLSVNISGRHFTQPNLISWIEEALDANKLEPHDFILEITEGAIMENSEAATVTLARLRALGIKLCMDDFGTGYSSLSYLHRFPLNMLKIDPTFISRMDAEREIREIVRTIVTLAHNLGMDVVAEGVETPEQLTQLREFGCEYAQGRLLSMPLQSQDANRMLDQEPHWAGMWQPTASERNGHDPYAKATRSKK